MEIYKLKVIEIKKYYLLVETMKREIGTIHISEISNFYVENLNDIFEAGDIVYGLRIKSYNNKKSFSLKRGHSKVRQKGVVETGGGFTGLKYFLENSGKGRYI